MPDDQEHDRLRVADARVRGGDDQRDDQVRQPSVPRSAAAHSRRRSRRSRRGCAALVQKRVARGRVEVVVGVQQRRAATLDVELNEEFLTALGGAIERARQQGYVCGRR